MPTATRASRATIGCDCAGTGLPGSMGCEQPARPGAIKHTARTTAMNRRTRADLSGGYRSGSSDFGRLCGVPCLRGRSLDLGYSKWSTPKEAQVATERMKIGFSAIVRIEATTQLGTFAKVADAIANAGGRIGAVDVHRVGRKSAFRDISIDVTDETQLDAVIDALKRIDGIRVVNVSDQTFLAHLGGKIEVVPRIPVSSRDALSRVYTPGVARICLAIAADPAKAFTLTVKKNMVAIVSDGTAVLGLGDIGPYAAMPVME